MAEVCRRHGVSQATFYSWKARFGGMDVSDARRLKQLEEENRKLKKLLPESMLDVGTPSELTRIRQERLQARSGPGTLRSNRTASPKR